MMLGCGSAYYAGQVGAQLIEDLARIPADAEPASEFRYRNPVIEADTLYVAVSQSGETYDTLAAVQELKRKGGRVLGVVNVGRRAIARECDGGIYLHAGPEISVASTKTFTATAVAFALLGAAPGPHPRPLARPTGRRIIAGLHALPGPDRARCSAGEDADRRASPPRWRTPPGMFFIGRVRGYPVALEGAQKLKEVSYIHAEAYPASELKHGPLALVEPGAAHRRDRARRRAVGEEPVHARRDQGPPRPGGGRRAHRPADRKLADHVDRACPKTEPELDPILLSVPLQLLAYHAAVALGRDVDKPRNLAKSVTVE